MCQVLCWLLVCLGSAVTVFWIILSFGKILQSTLSLFLIGKTIVDQVGIILGYLV